VKKILIVEDSKEMQEIYKDMFSDEGGRYKIEMASDGVAALRRVREEKFDLIILDIIMEPITGDAFFVYVRNDVKTMDLPIVIVSVLNPLTLEHLKKINHVEFLQKPIRKEELIKVIEDAFVGKI
jgi:CheY-like chemotaxis protein